MEEVEPAGFLFFSDSKGKLSLVVYHSFLVGGSVSVVGQDWGGEVFFGPVIPGYKVVIDETSGCSRVEECSGIGNFS